MFAKIGVRQASASNAHSVVLLLQLAQQRMGFYAIDEIATKSETLMVTTHFELLPPATTPAQAAQALEDKVALWSNVHNGSKPGPLDRDSLSSLMWDALNGEGAKRVFSLWRKRTVVTCPEDAALLTPATINWNAATNLALRFFANQRPPVRISEMRASLRDALNEDLPSGIDLAWEHRSILLDLLGLVMECSPDGRAELASSAKAVLRPFAGGGTLGSARSAALTLTARKVEGLERWLSLLLQKVPREELAERQRDLDTFLRTADTLEARKNWCGATVRYSGLLPMRMPLVELLDNALSIPVLTHILDWSGYENAA